MDPAFSWHEPPRLHRPVALLAFGGWNDAGEAATMALDHLIDFTGARLVGTIDHDEFNDHQVTRPEIVVDDDGERLIEWVDTEVFAADSDGTGLLMVRGEEPRLAWKRYARVVSNILDDVGVERVILLGAFLGQVPHTLDVPIIGAFDEATRHRHDLLPSRYEGPTGIVGVLSQVLRDQGFEVGSLWAACPHYLQGTANPKAALALVAKLGALAGIDVPSGDLEAEVAEWEARVAVAVSGNDELADYLAEMEQALADTIDDDGAGLVQEIERFLRNQ